MERMKFHWVKGEKTGSFKVTASSVDECIRVAEEEIGKAGAELDVFYSVK